MSFDDDKLRELLKKLNELASRPNEELEPVITNGFCPDGFIPCNESLEECPSDPGSQTYPPIYTADGDRCIVKDVMLHHRKFNQQDKTVLINGIRELVNYVAQIQELMNKLEEEKEEGGFQESKRSN